MSSMESFATRELLAFKYLTIVAILSTLDLSGSPEYAPSNSSCSVFSDSFHSIVNPLNASVARI